MKVILTKDVPKLGRKFEVKNVSSGYAQNLLIPKGLAIVATEQALKKAELDRKAMEGERKVMQDLIVKNIKDLDGVTVSCTAKANDKGHLFAGLHKEAVAEEIFKQTQLQIDPNFIQLEHPLKEVGEHEITVKEGDVSATFKLIITG